MHSTLFSRFRRLASPLHPRRLYSRFRRFADPLGFTYVRLWILAFDPRRLRATWLWALEMRRTMCRRRDEERLTVAIDTSAFWEPLTGVGWYLYRLLEHLAERDDVRLRLYGIDFIDKPGISPPVVEPPTGPAIERVRYRVPENLSFVHYYLADKLRRFRSRLIAADGNRVLFAPNYFLPPWFGRCHGRLVATVHDLSFREVPETMRESTRRNLETHFQDTVGRASLILTDSETVRGEIVASGFAEAARVRAIHLGPGLLEPGSAAGGAPPAGVPAHYVLHVGTVEPRKGLPTLLEAWRILRRRRAETPALVLCGGLGWKTSALEREIAAGREEGWLVHFGYLESEQVTALYRGASAVVMPSIYEGFGLPAVEAMKAGIPLVLSDIPVLREVGGEAAHYAVAGNPEAWAERLGELLSDAALRADLVRRGRERARLFDWRRTAGATVEAWMDAWRDPPAVASVAGTVDSQE